MALRLTVRAAILAALFSLLIALDAALVAAQPAGEAAAAAAPALVAVRATFSAETTSVQIEPGRQSFCNTGFFVDSEGRVLTSLLAVAGCQKVQVVTVGGRRAEARVAAVDQVSQLALLESDLSDTPVLELAGQVPAPGTWVGLLGVAGCEQVQTNLRAGTITGRDGSLRLHGIVHEGLLSADIDVPVGCAAAPLVNSDGHLVGVVLAVRHGEERGRECYILPSEGLQPVLERLRRGQSRRLGWLGICVADEAGEREGARVAAVLESSPAHRAGIRPDDVLLDVGGVTIEEASVLAEQIASAGPRSSVRIGLLREGRLLAVNVDLAPRPFLIFGGLRRPGEQSVRLSAPLRSVRELLEENRRLQRRVEELEGSLQRLERSSR